MSPPTLLVCLSKGSWTASAVVERGSFAVNLLHARAQGAAELFAGPTFNRFSQVDWRPSPLLGLPWLVADALAVAECQVSDARVVGDHTVVFGEVVGVSQEPDVPLLYGLRSFSTWREAI
jgi:flavin reductase (DIM6/NTAB) family NADH-FMN oxidoreductase RutF